MCGRFVVARASAELVADYGVDEPGDDLPEPSWNIAPTDQIPVIIDSLPRSPGVDAGAEADAGADAEANAGADAAGEADASEPSVKHDAGRRIRRLESAKWGLVPAWAKDPSVGVRSFNARSESAASKPTFRTAVAKRRAVIPSTGYYEWRKGADGVKQPHFIHLDGGELLMAGLYEWWRDPTVQDAPWLLSATILTRAATGELATIHDRMPVFLDRGHMDAWLDPATTGDDALVRAIAEHGAEVEQRTLHYPVDRRVGNVRSEGPELIEPIEATAD